MGEVMMIPFVIDPMNYGCPQGYTFLCHNEISRFQRVNKGREENGIGDDF